MPLTTDYGLEPIAIVGSSCRFPGGASSPSKLWELLKSPRDLLQDIPTSRFNVKGFYNENGDYHGSTNVTKSYFLEEDHRVFDHSFFNIIPKEAEAMDPQQRMLLEVVYEGIESAGYSIDQLKGSQTAVYVGQMTADYSDLLLRDIDSAPTYLATGVSRSIMSNRVSYFFDWKGPSETIDTACSSSLVALHHAVQTLRSGESSIAVAAGVNLILGPELYIFESKLHMLSPTGRSRMWDADADGYARGEGFASVILKTLKQAIADNDHIECIIRNTGVNQDGRTTGITMPGWKSQADLIHNTYSQCGLDYHKPENRCQYFEAHGTGTPAGDPVEARAVKTVFFPSEDQNQYDKHDVLFVGSVKSVIGHLEGTAGLAGLLKAMLAVQHAVIPPNMHFNQLNPDIEPFYGHLQIPTKPQQWPALPKGVPRRASVNSFGFGGTNAHAIIESWVSSSESEVDNLSNDRSLGPITLSANSERSLVSTITHLADALKSQPHANLANLAWTLQNRRTNFRYRTSFSALNREDLITKLYNEATKAKEGSQYALAASAVSVSEEYPPRILGVFTGQGAQWPTMGVGLYEQSIVFQQSIQKMEESLAALPDAPSWLLSEELKAPANKSRVGEAEISQPLCTAIQVALVDLLKASGITFSAVVGHSSGEIAAAYAAGHISAVDAIRIAYYRGLYAHLARSATGIQGKMMAIGMRFDEAREFCQRDQFLSRLKVAASNSRSSVTLSGDGDAIDEAKAILDQEKVFARVLKVDTAYHSHHMEPCAGPYLNALQRCDIREQTTSKTCKWYSSVYGSNGRRIDDRRPLRDTYWVDNMVKPVLFSQALDRAITEEHCHDMVLEVGPHPALKGPATDSLKTLTGIDLPYSGVLKRGEHDMNSFSAALGFIWAHFQSASPVVDFEGFRRACLGEQAVKPTVSKDLPSYAWDHDKVLWKESRHSRRFREREDPIHELLGTPTEHGSRDEVRWRNVMKLSELGWLRGHQFQGQVLFPAAGYVTMAFEASMHLARDLPVRLVELQDLVIHRAITLEENSAGADVTFIIRVTSRTAHRITAEYFCYSGEVDSAGQDQERNNFAGRAVLTLGESNPDALPPRKVPLLPMNPVEIHRLYSSLSGIGLDYSGDFLMKSVRRRLETATGVLHRISNSKLRVHPATLDAAFHGLFAAFCYPGDGRLWAPYLPTSIRCVRVNTSCPEVLHHSDTGFVADCHLTVASAKEICGDVDIFCEADAHPEIQIEALTCSSFTKGSARDDRKLFAQNVWKRDIVSGIDTAKVIPQTQIDIELTDICDRSAYYYLRELRKQIAPEEIDAMEWHFQCLMKWALNEALPQIESGNHPRVKREWAKDTRDIVLKWRKEWPQSVDLEAIGAIGEHQAAIVRGQVTALQVMMENDLLTRLYRDGLGLQRAYSQIATISSQLSHQYPHMKVLEIGAGTGGATVHVLKGLSQQFRSYTYSDVSPGFFENAQARFKDSVMKMEFKVFDVERDPADQGYQKHSFDLIVAANVLHATKFLRTTLRHCRDLLRPGGRLMLLEITSDTLRPQFTFSVLPGWWLGRDDGRTNHPTISETEWNSILVETGFSGIDTVCGDIDDPEKYCVSVMTSQAIDQRVATLREPLTNTEDLPQIENLLLIGGETLQTTNIARKLQVVLRPYSKSIEVVKKLENIELGSIKSGAAIISLAELDQPSFKKMTPSKFSGLQTIFGSAKYILWITRGLLTLSSHNSSQIRVPVEEVFEWNGGENDEPALYTLIYSLIAESLVASTQNIWIHGAGDTLAQLIMEKAKKNSSSVFLSTSSPQNGASQKYIHPCTTLRDFQSIAPHDLEVFVNMDSEDLAVLEKIPQLSSRKPVTVKDVLDENVEGKAIVLSYNREQLLHFMKDYSIELDNSIKISDSPVDHTVTIDKVSELTSIALQPATIISWEHLAGAQVIIKPVDPRSLFSAEKTYFLVGLTGDLGLSLCDWMIQHGARHIAITSRNPRVDPEIIKDFERRGTKVRIFALDIADNDALLEVYSEICSTMPVIGGVANAAMVLRDKSFANMTLEDFEVVLNPKVRGSKNLDELFYSADLEFFILFSSLTCVTGNPGQSNYAAANMFMTSLASQRRKRGVAASIMDIAMLLGVGFVARSIEQYEEHMKKYRYMSISEPEMRTIFAEAIVAGLPDSDQDPELIIGIGEDSNAPWHGNPRFGYYVREENNILETSKQSSSLESVQNLLSMATSDEETLAVVEACFSKKLGLILQVPEDSIDKTSPLINLGIDSLVAVEIRSWFLKELMVDVPVLKVLSGASVSDLCQDVIAKIPESLCPQPGNAAVTDSKIDIQSPVSNAHSQTLLEPLAGEGTLPPSSSSESILLQSDRSKDGTSDTTLSETTSSENVTSLELMYQRTGEMSHAQARLYFLHKYLQDKSTYNVTFYGQARGTVDIARLSKALDIVAGKHEILRSSFYIDKSSGKAIQAVQPASRIALEYRKIVTESEAQGELDVVKHTEFDLTRGKSMRVTVLTQTPDLHYIIFCYHHIILDGISWGLFLRDLDKAYSFREIPVPLLQSIDLSIKQIQDRAPQNLQKELKFWKEVYNEPPEVLPLFPFSKVKCRQTLKNYDTATFEMLLNETLTKKVKQSSSQLKSTSFHFHLATLLTLLSRCLNTTDISIGIVNANRADVDDMETVGYFLDVLPLRFKFDHEVSFDTLAQQTRETVFAGLVHSRAPFEAILEHLKVSRSGDHNPMFQVAVNYRMGAVSHNSLGSCDIEWKATVPARNPYDLTIDISEAQEGTLIAFTTQRYLYSAPDTQLLMNWYQSAIEGLASNTSMRITEYPLSSTADIERAISLGRGEQVPIDWPATLAHRIEEMASMHSQSTAVKDGNGQKLSYKELMAKAAALVNCLRTQSVNAGDYIAVLLTPTANVVVCIVAVMLLGCVYVPLDLHNPALRLRAIISDCNPKLTICDEDTHSQALALADTTEIFKMSDVKPAEVPIIYNQAEPAKPAVILYTSGSTGKPKGVILTHSGLLHQIWNITKIYHLDQEIVLQQSSFGFDVSLEQIFSALANGGSVVIVSKDVRGDSAEIAKIMLWEKITYTMFVPSEYLALLRYGYESLKKCTSWCLAFAGGEALPAQLRSAFRGLNLENLTLINTYGATELSVTAARDVIEYNIENLDASSDSLSGKVQPNYSIIILDDKLKPVPIGFPGEICVGGVGVTDGYLNRPDETVQKFIENPFVSTQDVENSWTKLYRSGDKGRILEDGSIEFLGRIDGDTQVKVRGFRIELGEIANVILQSAKSTLIDAAVSVRGESDIIVAFVVFAANFSRDKDEYLERLRMKLPLPGYMCPAMIVPVDNIPRNVNGKKDRSAIDKLPIPSPKQIETEGKMTSFETKLKDIWSGILQDTTVLFNIGPETDFFHVGGNSLLLLRLQSELRLTFHSQISLAELFQASTLRDMALRIQYLAEDKSSREQINWDEHISSLCEGLSSHPKKEIPKPRQRSEDGMRVVLTGATGFLGRNILARLVEDEQVKEVHCIAIRSGREGEERHVDIHNSKIVEYPGNLSDENFGLTDLQIQLLSETADAIIHNGADVSFLKSYQSLHRPNVQSTQALASIAIPRSIPIHFISTASVSKFAEKDVLPEISVREFAPPPNADGYSASKWASEAFLEKISLDYGLPTWIYRPASIVGEGAPKRDMVKVLLDFSRILRAVPEMGEIFQGAFDFVKVEDVSVDIVRSVLDSVAEVEHPPKVTFVHNCSEDKVLPSEFQQYLERVDGTHFDIVSLKEWGDMARDAGLDSVIYESLDNLIERNKSIVFPVIKKGVN
ncbi:polyketide synthase [Xylogone sp. PMI_703]|nr:polyketide synthase [Xylogone sp. PMI_703]